MSSLRIGIDVGGRPNSRHIRLMLILKGTNTDAILLDSNPVKKPDASVLAWHKTITTPDITSGIQVATTSLLASVSIGERDIICATIGTTVRMSFKVHYSSASDSYYQAPHQCPY